MKRISRIQRESNPWCQSEAAVDFALCNRYPCQQDRVQFDMAIDANANIP